jgi:hypothetical protein
MGVERQLLMVGGDEMSGVYERDMDVGVERWQQELHEVHLDGGQTNE